jgi:regulation of enolase protein 1 (concanavalin A-like superfamily)
MTPITKTMRIALGCVGCVVVAWLLAIPLRADEKEKEGPKLKGWGEVVNPDDDCAIAVKEGALTLTLPGTAHDFAAELQKWNAPRVFNDQSGDFIVEVKVSGTFKPGTTSVIDGRLPYHGAGLLLAKDKNTYISLHRGCVYIDERLRHYANFELRKDGLMVISNYAIEIPDQDCYLRLERRGDKVHGLSSPDGVHWSAYEPITCTLPDTVQLGIVAVTSSNVPLTVRCEDLTIFRKTKAQ